MDENELDEQVSLLPQDHDNRKVHNVAKRLLCPLNLEITNKMSIENYNSVAKMMSQLAIELNLDNKWTDRECVSSKHTPRRQGYHPSRRLGSLKDDMTSLVQQDGNYASLIISPWQTKLVYLITPPIQTDSCSSIAISWRSLRETYIFTCSEYILLSTGQHPNSNILDTRCTKTRKNWMYWKWDCKICLWKNEHRPGSPVVFSCFSLHFRSLLLTHWYWILHQFDNLPERSIISWSNFW